jgi:hypothetical protein
VSQGDLSVAGRSESTSKQDEEMRYSVRNIERNIYGYIESASKAEDSILHYGYS